MAELGDSILDFLTSYLGAQASALFKGEDGVFQRTAMLGVAGDAPVPQLFREREGLLGRVAAEGRPTVISDVPDGYLKLGSALGHDRPRHLVIAPFSADGVVNAVVEFGFLHPVEDRTLELLARVEPTAGVALRSARYRTELRNLLEETQRQSEELQVQSEELRVSNEELEEQGRALKETAVRLEQEQGRARTDQFAAGGTGAAAGNPARRPRPVERSDRGQGARAGAGQPVQVRFPGQYEP